jgi:hypothetical protein
MADFFITFSLFLSNEVHISFFSSRSATVNRTTHDYTNAVPGLDQNGSAIHHDRLTGVESFLHQEQTGLRDVMSFSDSAYRQTFPNAFVQLLPLVCIHVLPEVCA